MLCLCMWRVGGWDSGIGGWMVCKYARKDLRKIEMVTSLKN